MKSVLDAIREGFVEGSKSLGKTGRVVILTAGVAAATLSPGEANGQAGSSPDNPIVLSCGEDIATDLAENINDLGSSRYYQVENLGGIIHQFDSDYVYSFTMDDGTPADIDTLRNQDLTIRVYPGEVYRVHFVNEGMNRTFGITFESCGNEGGEVVVAQIDNSLPITLSSFEGYNDGKVNLLEWETQAEDGSSEQVIEYSTDGLDFIEAGRVQSVGIDGGGGSYQFRHENAPSGLTHYRLRNIDNDGSNQIQGKIITILNNFTSLEGIEADINIVNNVAGQGITLEYIGDQQAEVSIYTAAGQTLYSGPANGQFNSKDLLDGNGPSGNVFMTLYRKGSQKSYQANH